MKKKLYFGLCLFFLWLPHSPSFAFFSKDTRGFFIRSHGISVSRLINLMTQSYHIPTVISARVTGNFTGEIKNTSPEQVLNNLSDRFNLVWYYDGNTLFVNSSREVDNKIIIPTYTDAPKLYDNIKSELNFSSPFNILELRKLAKAIKVSGTPQFVTDVVNIVQKLDTQEYRQANNKVVVKIFPLLYTSAKDISYGSKKKNITIPGIATELRSLLGGGNVGLGARAGGQAAGAGGQAAGGAVNSLPKIIIDERQNALTIMGLESKMDAYLDLIHKLDQPQQPINISVKIIDVNEGDIDNLGVKWEIIKKIANNKITFNKYNPGSTANEGMSAVIDNTKGLTLTINALKNAEKARVVSNPSVFTLNNMPAVLDQNTTFYARLQGKENSKLEQISTGQTLEVTPHLIRTKTSKQEILLRLSIEDGSPAGNMQQIDNLPQTQNSQISTIARLKEGQSLLIGGFMRKEKHVNKEKIPILGSLPIVGNIFKSDRKSKRSSVRLFLIQATPLSL